MSGSYPELATLDVIEDLLGGYANARLRPSAAAMSRMRRPILREAAVAGRRRQAQLRTTPAPDVRRRAFRVQRRAIAFGAAALLTLGTSAAVLAAQPGSVLYDAKVALTETLPGEVAGAGAVERPVKASHKASDRLPKREAGASGGHPKGNEGNGASAGAVIAAPGDLPGGDVVTGQGDGTTNGDGHGNGHGAGHGNEHGGGHANGHGHGNGDGGGEDPD